MRNKTFKVFVAGVILGILFAPDKGSNTRKKIVARAGDFADSIKLQFDEVTDKVNDFVNDSKESLENLVNDAKTSLQKEDFA